MRSSYGFLSTIVSMYERTDRPIQPDRLVDEFELDRSEITQQLHWLYAHHLLKPAPNAAGYVPTDTAFELLELELDDDTLIILDVFEEHQD